MRRLWLGLTVAAALASTFCATGGMSVQHINKSDLRLREVTVRWDSMQTVAGLLPPGVRKTDDLIASRLPSKVVVQWQTPDGVLHEEKMEVPPLPRRLTRKELPTIIVTFTNEGVTISTTGS